MKTTINLNLSSADRLFEKWVMEVNNKRAPRLSYSNYQELKKLFLGGKCPDCSDNLGRVDVESYD